MDEHLASPATQVVSYSRKDSAIVQPLVKLLRTTGREIFLDTDDLRYGESWREQIAEAIGQADRLLLFWSRNSARSNWVEEEWRLAVETRDCLVVPILLDKTPLPAELQELHGASELRSIVSALRQGRRFRRAVVGVAGVLVVLGGMLGSATFLGPADNLVQLGLVGFSSLATTLVTSPFWVTPLLFSWYRTRRLRRQFVTGYLEKAPELE